MRPEQAFDMQDGEASRAIPDRLWEGERFRWLSAVRHDVELSDRAYKVASCLVFDFANRQTAQCHPSNRQIAAAIKRSPDTVKRGVAELVKGGWIARRPGRWNGEKSHYIFLRRAEVVPLSGVGKGGKSAPLKGGGAAPLHEKGRGADLHGKGGKSAPAYNIAKPYKNHRGAVLLPKRSENPTVIADADRLVQRLRDGRGDALDDAPVWVLNHILAAGLLTEAECLAAGLSQAEKED